jgi:membrane-associated protease RseP (regulator of RpoE activity)
LTLSLLSGDWLILAAIIIGCYLFFLLPLQNSDSWRRRGVTTWGPIPLLIFFRTTRGLDLLNRLSRPKGLWRVLAVAGVPLVVLGMCYFLAVLLLISYLMIQSPPEPSNYNAPRNILLIPGLNEYVPFVWGWIALFVTMVVHEFAHGILARVEGVRVKSMGVVTFLFAPVAAFVEPDEEELFGTPERAPAVKRGARIRILSAGVVSNFAVAAIAMALFFGPVIGSITPLDRVVVADVQGSTFGEQAGFQRNMVVAEVNGVQIDNLTGLYQSLAQGSAEMRVLQDNKDREMALNGQASRGILAVSVFEGSPAAEAGLPPMSVISAIDGVPTMDLAEFRSYMNGTVAGQNITVLTSRGIYQIRLTSKPGGYGFIGIGISGDAVFMGGVTFQQAPSGQVLSLLKAIPANGIGGFLYLLSLPFIGISGFSEKGFPGFSGWITDVFQPAGWALILGEKFFWIANLLLWVGWVNLYAGLFNCLPAVPLDGGHIFRDLIQGMLERVVSAKEAERITRTIVALLAWLILTSLIITVVAPFTRSLAI